MKRWTVTPAYGRDYKSKVEAAGAWEDGKDFVLQPDGVYVSVRDARPAGVGEVNIRYAKLRKVTVVRC